MADPGALEELRRLAYNAKSMTDRWEAKRKYKEIAGTYPKRVKGDKH